MEKSCPECGTETGFVEHTARVLQGTCAGCGRTFTILQESPAVSAGPPDGESTGAPAGPGPTGPPCSVCGAALALRSSSDTSLQARCSSCSTTFTYVLATSPFPGPSRSFPPRGRPAPPEERGGFGPSRSRPCRECGGPLRFTTDPDGNVTGECGSCGNRFTLPPRRDFGGRRDRGDRRGPGRGGPPSYRRGGRYPPGRGGGEGAPRFRSSGPPFRRRERREDADDEDDTSDRRRRRPRRE